MSESTTIRIAIQKSGRLFEKSQEILNKAGISFESSSRKLITISDNFPLEIIFVRDDDIPGYLKDGACDIGIVGYNEYYEQIVAPSLIQNQTDPLSVSCIQELNFGKCHLALALPKESKNHEKLPLEQFLNTIKNLKIATSYPKSLHYFLKSNDIRAEIITVAGSVEITPTLGITNAICDLVSTGSTLKSNGLYEIATIFTSQAVLLKSETSIWNSEKLEIFAKFKQRIDGVLKAKNSKYLMMNAPKKSLDRITSLIPGLEHPTILPLYGSEEIVAVHVVVNEEIFWDSMQQLKELGASSILVVPIEKIIV